MHKVRKKQLIKLINQSINQSISQLISQLITYMLLSPAYDFSFLLRALLLYVANHDITYRRQDGTQYTRPLLRSEPRVLFKNQNTPISITIRYTCPREYCECTLTVKERKANSERGIKIRACPFRRSIKFR